MKNINKQKNNLEKRYEAILATPKNKIDFSFFLAINEYVRVIDRNDYLRKLLHSSSPFEYSNPYNLLIERGRAVSDINKVFENKKVPNVLVSYFNLYAVYIGIEDMDNELEKTSFTENRLKMAKHLKNIQDREKIVGIGYFWTNKNKYYEWARILHRHMLKLIEKSEKTNTTEAQTHKNNNDIDYKYDLKNQLSWFTASNKEVEFKGKRAIVFHFFYTLDKTGNEEYKTYHDFNKYLLDSDIRTNINSVAFRQSINNINKRMANEMVDIKSVIELKNKNNPKEINRYKWKVKI